MRKLLLASAGLWAFALPALAFQPAPAPVASFSASGNTAQTGNFAYTTTATNTTTNTLAVNPVQGSSQSGATYSLGTGATPAVWASNPNGTVGQLLNVQGVSSSQGGPASVASVSNTGSASNTSQATAVYTLTGAAQVGQSSQSIGGGYGGPTLAISNSNPSQSQSSGANGSFGATLSNQNTVTTTSASNSTGNATSSGQGAYALNSGTTGSTGQGSAGLYQTVSTTTQSTGSTGWATGTQGFNFAANASGFQTFQ
jgi:hypothetical protein